MKDKNIWNIQFPIIKNISPRTLAQDIKGIPTDKMPEAMNEMFKDVSKNFRKSILERIEKLEKLEGQENEIKRLKDMLEWPLTNMDKK